MDSSSHIALISPSTAWVIENLLFSLEPPPRRTYSHRSCTQSSRALIGCSVSSPASATECNNLWPQFDPWAELHANARVFAHICDRRSENSCMREMLSRDSQTHSSGLAFPKLCAVCTTVDLPCCIIKMATVQKKIMFRHNVEQPMKVFALTGVSRASPPNYSASFACKFDFSCNPDHPHRVLTFKSALWSKQLLVRKFHAHLVLVSLFQINNPTSLPRVASRSSL